jgi:hypothetical protein
MSWIRNTVFYHLALYRDAAVQVALERYGARQQARRTSAGCGSIEDDIQIQLLMQHHLPKSHVTTMFADVTAGRHIFDDVTAGRHVFADVTAGRHVFF